MASCSDDSKVKIWDLRKGKALFSLYSHSGAVNAVDFSFAGDYFASGGTDKNLLLWRSNFYDSKTREGQMIPPKVKVQDDRVIKFNPKIEVEDKTASFGGANRLFRESLGNGVQVFDEKFEKKLADEKVVEVQADEKISGTLDKINGQIGKILMMLRVALFDVGYGYSCFDE